MKALVETIKFELKKHWKLIIGASTLVYFLKYLLYLMHVEDYSKPVGDAIILMFFIGSAVAVYLGSSAFTSEREKNTLTFLFTRHSSRKHIITGKLISILLLVLLFLLLTIPSLTPSPTIHFSWITRAFSFVFDEAIFFVGLIATLIALPFMWSSFSKTSSGSFIYSLITLCISTFLIIKFISYEILWHTYLFIFATVFLVINQTLGQGEIFPEKAVMKKNIKLLTMALPIYLIFLFLCGIFYDCVYISDSQSTIQSMLDRPYNNKIITNRMIETKSHFTPARTLNALAVDLRADIPVISNKNTKTNQQIIPSSNNWTHVLKRNQRALSVSPDGKMLLYKDKRQIFGFSNMEKPEQLCLKTEFNDIPLGLTRDYYTYFTWLPDNSLVYSLSRHTPEKKRKQNNLKSAKKFTINLLTPQKNINKLLEIQGYSLGKIYSLNSGTHILSQIKNLDNQRMLVIIETKTKKMLQIIKDAKTKLDDLEVIHTLDTRILVKRKGKNIILNLKKLLEMDFNTVKSKNIAETFIKMVTTEKIESLTKNIRLNSHGWISVNQEYKNEKKDTLLTIEYKYNEKVTSKQFFLREYKNLKFFWNRDNTAFAVSMIDSDKSNCHNEKLKGIKNSKDYALAPFYYTTNLWEKLAKKVNLAYKLKLFILKENIKEKNIAEKNVNLYDYYTSSCVWINKNTLVQAFDNNIDLIDLNTCSI